MALSALDTLLSRQEVDELPLRLASRKELDQVLAYADGLLSTNRISGEMHRQLTGIIVGCYLLRRIEEKLEKRVTSWSERFADRLNRGADRFLEKLS
jgi:hypothetical protein